jgi:hypothetical protein
MLTRLSIPTHMPPTIAGHNHRPTTRSEATNTTTTKESEANESVDTQVPNG